MQIKEQSAPILLFNDECGVCRSIASWVKKQAQAGSGATNDCRTTDWPGSRGVAGSQSRPEYLGCLRDNSSTDAGWLNETRRGSRCRGSATFTQYQMVHLDLRNQRLRGSAIPGDT
jgi:hypothetical protein